MNGELSSAIDELSRKLLNELQKDARIPFAELARRIGLSPSATAERVRRLEDQGIIRAYRVDIDPSALGLGILAYVRMTCDGEKYKRFIDLIGTMEAVREGSHVMGTDTLFLKILVASTDELEELILRFLPYGTLTASFVLSQPVLRTVYNLDSPSRNRHFSMALRSKSQAEPGYVFEERARREHTRQEYLALRNPQRGRNKATSRTLRETSLQAEPRLEVSGHACPIDNSFAGRSPRR
jgi:Lrp/AsnC family transcriptional regulator, leucine-responsive regulatory protein